MPGKRASPVRREAVRKGPFHGTSLAADPTARRVRRAVRGNGPVATPEPRPGPTQRPDRFGDPGTAGGPAEVVVIEVGSSSSAMHRMVGSVAVNLARHSPVPVIIVP